MIYPDTSIHLAQLEIEVGGGDSLWTTTPLTLSHHITVTEIDQIETGSIRISLRVSVVVVLIVVVVVVVVVVFLTVVLMVMK